MDRQEIKARKNFLLDTLIESGVDLNFVDEQGLTPLIHAAQLPDEKCRTRNNLLKLLLQHGAYVNIVDKKGPTCAVWGLHRRQRRYC